MPRNGATTKPSRAAPAKTPTEYATDPRMVRVFDVWALLAVAGRRVTDLGAQAPSFPVQMQSVSDERGRYESECGDRVAHRRNLLSLLFPLLA
jgi:hypothetical protein